MIGILMFWTIAYVPRNKPAHAQMLKSCQLRLTSHVKGTHNINIVLRPSVSLLLYDFHICGMI
jgi:hypothetical protein